MKSNLVIQAPVFSLSGYGAHARDIVLGLYNSDKYNIGIIPTGWGSTSLSNRFSVSFTDVITRLISNQISQQAEYAVVHIGLPIEFKQRLPRKTICVTAGIESDRLPAGWKEACNSYFDALIVPSTFVRNVFVQSGVTIPIHIVGKGVDTTIFNELPASEGSPSILGEAITTEFNFLSCGQWIPTSQDDRKGITNLLIWFCEAFAGDKNVGLILKSMSSNISSVDEFITRQRIDDIKGGRTYPKVYLVHGEQTDAEIASLFKHPLIKAFVSCTHGEGWGRSLLEAAASDLPILAPGWSGHMDFLDPSLIALFDHKIADVSPTNYSAHLFEQGMQWAYVDEADVKRKLHRCVDKYSIAKDRAVVLGKVCREKFSKTKTDADLVRVFDELIAPASNLILPAAPMQQY